MDRNFHIDDFERLLREKSEEFRMYPSKRIWHSIYNNIHPSRQWPSVAMSITLISAILLMGYLNTNAPKSYSALLEHNKTGQYFPLLTNSSKQFEISYTNIGKTASGVSLTKDNTAAIQMGNIKMANGNDKVTSNLFQNKVVPNISRIINFKDLYADFTPIKFYEETTKAKTNLIISENIYTPISDIVETNSVNNTIQITKDQTKEVFKNLEKIVNFDESPPIPIYDFTLEANREPYAIHSTNSTIKKNNLLPNLKEFISGEDKGWIENFAFYHKPSPKKWANKLDWQLYATPSIVYRILYNDPNFNSSLYTTPFAIAQTSQNINNVVIQKPSLGLEIGTALQYSITKGVKLKAGLQFNYTRYNSIAFQNTHPVTTKLTMHDYNTNVSYEEYRSTPYSNKSGLEAVKLHNETYQVSLPMGADVKLMGNENLQWNLGLTIQPTYVVGGKSYLISSDRRNYVKDFSMVNNWNLNAGFESFLTFKNNGLKYQIGPQFRTQLFSTNNKKFAVEERLFSFGLKFGISKTIK